MNKLILTLTIGLFLGFASSPATAQEEPKAAAPMMDEAMMAKWKEYSTPNENHKVLSQMLGIWDYTAKWWMSPDAPPEVSTGTASAKWLLDGRFIEQEAEGNSMGQPYHGKGIIGFDNAKKEYIATWVDSMGTGMMIGSGTYDAATKTLTESGSFLCPLNGSMNFRWVTKFIDENNYTLECYMTDKSGKESKAMELTYKRK